MIKEGDALYASALKLACAEEEPSKVLRLLEEAVDQGSIEAHVALAHWLKDGVHTEPDLKKAFALMKVAADNGHAAACYNVGVSLERGIGTRSNTRKAFYYYALGASLGDESACFEIYRCLFYGIGIDQRRDVALIVKKFLQKNKMLQERE